MFSSVSPAPDRLPGTGRVPLAMAVSASVFATLAAAAQPGPPDFARLGGVGFSAHTAPASWQASSDMVAHAAAVYPIGRSDGPPSESPAHRVALDAFRIDRTEVTNRAFAEYLNALPGRLEADSAPVLPGGSEASRHLSEGPEGSGLYPIIALDDDQARIAHRDGGFRVAPGFADHPVTETTWAGARAYCAWRRARLPSEAEWEAAARGVEGRLYPWGNSPPDSSRVFVSRRTGVTAPVGSRPAGATPRGVVDLSGSLAEWTSPLQQPYPYDPSDGREAPDAPGERVTRGGDYIYDTAAATLSATHRSGFSNAPGRGHRHIGFRCAAPAATGATAR